MSTIRTRPALMVLAMFGIWLGPAYSAPTTITPSPGYDARLREQRPTPMNRSVAIPRPSAPSGRKLHQS